MLRLPRIAAAIALTALAACRPAAAPGNQAEPARNAPGAKPALALPQPERPLDREGVLLAVIKARSAAAAGAGDQAAQAALDGKRFEFRIVLGCDLTTPGQAGAAAGFDAERRRVELSVRADAALTDPAIAAAAAGVFEAAEGFWIADPWLLAPHCAGAAPAPVARGGPDSAPAPQPEPQAGATASGTARDGAVALVQFFTPDEPRTQRRQGRPYRAEESLPEGSGPPAPGSWELVLTGRMRALGDARVIACHSPASGTPPACVVSVRFDRVTIEKRGSGERLAEWGGG